MISIVLKKLSLKTSPFKNQQSHGQARKASALTTLQGIAYRCFVWSLISQHIILSCVQAAPPVIKVEVSREEGKTSSLLTLTVQDNKGENTKGYTYSLPQRPVEPVDEDKIVAAPPIRYLDQGLDLKFVVDNKGNLVFDKLFSATHSILLSTYGGVTFKEGLVTAPVLSLITGDHIHNWAVLKGVQELTITPWDTIGDRPGQASVPLLLENHNTIKVNRLNLSEKSYVANHDQAKVSIQEPLELKKDSALFNVENGVIKTRGVLSGAVQDSFTFNKGTWIHKGELALEDQKLELFGKTIWQSNVDLADKCFEEMHEGFLGMLALLRPFELTRSLEAKKSYWPKGMAIINHGHMILHNQGLVAKRGGIDFVNRGEMDLEGVKKQTFRTFKNYHQVNFKGLSSTIETCDRRDDAVHFSSRDPHPIFERGEINKKDGLEDMKEPIAFSTPRFVNQGTIHVAGLLNYMAQEWLDKAVIRGDLNCGQYYRTLEELTSISCFGTVYAPLGETVIRKNFTRTNIAFLDLTTHFPFYLAAKITVPGFSLNSTKPIFLGGADYFGHIQTTELGISIEAPHIVLNGMLDSQGGVCLKAPNGSVFLGNPKTKPLNRKHLFGALKEDRAIQPQHLQGYHYKKNNGTLISANTTIYIAGAHLDLSYSNFFSHIRTCLESTNPFVMVSGSFTGNGDLEITAPKVKLSYGGTRKAVFHPYFCDYMISPPTQIKHLGDVGINAQTTEIVGTAVQATCFLINDKNYTTQNIRLIPIPLASGVFNSGFRNDGSVGAVKYFEIINPSYTLSQVFKLPDTHGYLSRILTRMALSEGAPTFKLSNAFKVKGANLFGSLTLSAPKAHVKAGTVHLTNNTPRQADSPRVSQQIDLKKTPLAKQLRGIQSTIGRPLPGRGAPPVDELPLVSPEPMPALKSSFDVPLDLVCQDALAEKGCLPKTGGSGESLVSGILKRSKQVRKTHQAGNQKSVSQTQISAIADPLLYYKANGLGKQADLCLHLPASSQSSYGQPGDMNVGDFKIETTGDTFLAGLRLNLYQKGVLEAENITLASQAQTQTGSTPGIGEIWARQQVAAPMTIHSDRPVSLEVRARNTSTFRGAQVDIQGDMTHQAGQKIITTTVDMVDTNRSGGKNNGTVTLREHCLPTTIKVSGKMTESAPEHVHEGTQYEANINAFYGKTITATTKVNHTTTTHTQHSKKWYGKKKSREEHTQTPLGACQPTYKGTTLLDTTHYWGAGSVFEGTLIDQTQLFALYPVITKHVHKLRTNSNCLGITKGLKVDQGQEIIICPAIHGNFYSSLRTDTQAAENILRLTSTILDLYDTKITKKMIKDEYIPKEWHHIKETGNAKSVALVVGLIVTIATGSMGGALLPESISTAVTETMAKAAFASLCGQAASSIVVNQGNLKKVGKELFKAPALKKIAIAAATAGLTHNLCEHLNIPELPQTPGGYALRHLVKSGVKMHVDFAINGGSYKECFKSESLIGVVDAISGYLNFEIGQYYEINSINFLAHKVAHAAVGALSSAALGEDAIAGALGAAAAATAAEAIFNANQDRIAAGLSEEEKQDLRQHCIDMGKYAALAAAVISGRDPGEALRAATVAVEENFDRQFDHQMQNFAIEELSNQVQFKQKYAGLNSIDAFRHQPYEALADKIYAVLIEKGASEQDIALVMSNASLKRFIDGCEEFDRARYGCIDIYTKDKASYGCGINKKDILQQGLGILTQAGTSFNYLASRYPTLTNMSLTAIQVAVSGPAGYLRDIVMEKTGVQGQIDRVVEATEEWASQTLQTEYDMNKTYADVLSAGGGFGIGLGLTAVGAVNKDKALHKAEEVAEKVKEYVTINNKKIHGNSLNYVGETHVYSIHRVSDGKAMKVGESTQGFRKSDGASKRAEAQARKLKTETGEFYRTKIRKKYENKKDAKTYETNLIKRTRDIKGEDTLPLNKNGH